MISFELKNHQYSSLKDYTNIEAAIFQRENDRNTTQKALFSIKQLHCVRFD
jgi:hypothetical protein